MKTHTATTLLAALLACAAHAGAGDLPQKAPLGKYAGLWNNSPFTSRPVVEARAPEPEENPLEDYALTGVSPVADGFRVTLINRNDPSERIIVDSSRPNAGHDFKILNINRSPGRPMSTTVELTHGNHTGTIAFEQELLTLTPPPAAPQQPQPQPDANQGEGQQEQAQGARRQPRPRVVPPPANAQQLQQARAAAQQQRAAAQGDRAQRTQGTRERPDRRGRR